LEGGAKVTLDHHALARQAYSTLFGGQVGPDVATVDQDRLAQWWGGLSAIARARFAAAPDEPVPSELLDEVMVGGVRIVGQLAGGESMQWRFAAETREFIVRQAAAGHGDRLRR
jgi:hypothetical protein